MSVKRHADGMKAAKTHRRSGLQTRATEDVEALQRFGKQASPVLDRFLQPQEVLIKQLEQDSLSHEPTCADR